jgi:hypothetical protein
MGRKRYLPQMMQEGMHISMQKKKEKRKEEKLTSYHTQKLNMALRFNGKT